MKKFNLKTKFGDNIFSILASDINEANNIFSKMKNLRLNELLSIFIIEQESKN